MLLGFRMDLMQVLRAGSSGLLFAIGTMAGTFLLGAWLARLLRVESKTATLLSTGTAICGGSAIAAISGIVGATSAQIAVATGVVFILNGLALFIFPPLGDALGLTATQFGTWAGVAIHDVSSVVGAAQSFAAQHGGAIAVDTATVVKLSRVLWIIPICLIAAMLVRRSHATDPSATHARPRTPPIPWFIALFILAAAARTLLPGPLTEAAPTLLTIAKSGMTIALLFIGAGLTREALKQVGWRALSLGVILWIAIAATSLIVVRATVT